MKAPFVISEYVRWGDVDLAGIIHYAARHYDRTGHLEFIHSETGVRTLKDEFDKVAWHNEQHLAQIDTALRGRAR